MSDERPGYDDTPIIPGTNYRVHDKNRPQPPVVTPPTESTQEKPGDPPSDAEILFSGADLSKWEHEDGSPASWIVSEDHMEVKPGSGNIQTKESLGDCQLHVEWAAPEEVDGDSQQRGNSGVFMMGEYEIQVLDCYNNPTYADGSTAAIYGQCPPLVNACRKPGEWQYYDIVWIAPRFEGEKVLAPASITVFHNGILVHHKKELIGPTTHKDVTPYEPHDTEGPLKLQDHGDMVRYRNIWYRPIGEYDRGAK